jgi:hypothetical protein
MRYPAFTSILALLLVGCGTPQAAEEQAAPEAEAPAVVDTRLAEKVGVYVASDQGEDGSTASSSLWIRSSGTYVVQEKAAGDELPQGRMGSWKDAGTNLVMVDGREGPPVRWEWQEGGLRQASPMRRMDMGNTGARLERKSGKGDEPTPAMVLEGLHRIEGQSHSFEPCGAARVFPLAVGEYLDALMDARRNSGQPDDAALLLRIHATVALADASEGNEQDEYIWLQAAPQLRKSTFCP